MKIIKKIFNSIGSMVRGILHRKGNLTISHSSGDQKDFHTSSRLPGMDHSHSFSAIPSLHEKLSQDVGKTSKQIAGVNIYANSPEAVSSLLESSISSLERESSLQTNANVVYTPSLSCYILLRSPYWFLYFLRDFLISLTPRSRARRKALLETLRTDRNSFDLSLVEKDLSKITNLVSDLKIN